MISTLPILTTRTEPPLLHLFLYCFPHVIFVASVLAFVLIEVGVDSLFIE